MSAWTLILFIAGLLLVWGVFATLAHKMTRPDKMLECNKKSSDDVRLSHLEERLSAHRRWWMGLVPAAAMALYVVLAGMVFLQDVAEDVRATVVQQEEERSYNQCRFRNFVQEFFEMLETNQFSATDVAQLEGYAELEPSARLFVDNLALAISEQAITISEARKSYVDSFPVDERLC